MSFKALCLAHAPDADPEKHRSVIETGRYKLFTVAVKSQPEALRVARNLHETEQIHSLMLCPGFTHRDCAELFDALGGEVAITVARGDGPGNRIVGPVIQKEFFDLAD